MKGTLYGSLTSPYVRLVRLVMQRCGAEDRVRFVLSNPFDASHRVHNPLGRVPALIIYGGPQLLDTPLIVRTLGLGALRSYQGDLYWGTMQLPGQGAAELVRLHGPVADPSTLLDRTTRPVSLFRARDPADNPVVEVLYGDLTVPVFQPATGTWAEVPTGLGPSTHGPAGFGRAGTVYTWSMAEHGDALYIGTLDASTYRYGDAIVAGQPAPADVGADLFVIPGRDQPAIAVTTDGGGNPFNQGFRNLVSLGATLYLGTANASNRQDLGPGQRGGGWELLGLE